MFNFFGKLVGWGLMALTALALIAFPSGLTVAALLGCVTGCAVCWRWPECWLNKVDARQEQASPAHLEFMLNQARQLGAQDAAFEIMRRQDA